MAGGVTGVLAGAVSAGAAGVAGVVAGAVAASLLAPGGRIGWPAAEGGGVYWPIPGSWFAGCSLLLPPRSSWSTIEPLDALRAAMTVRLSEVTRKPAARSQVALDSAFAA